ncbi:hypothetical protein G5I_08601 [Acromyrmex echinatior]|uniref:Uncharacterized protein n=1 Tax=Acromyrmex echinatior TaxID=103372 RepID=F4WRZ5_ACREC|nr:hypothetical protein G5I_08601 [Acromyrmex echinatior]
MNETLTDDSKMFNQNACLHRCRHWLLRCGSCPGTYLSHCVCQLMLRVREIIDSSSERNAIKIAHRAFILHNDWKLVNDDSDISIPPNLNMTRNKNKATEQKVAPDTPGISQVMEIDNLTVNIEELLAENKALKTEIKLLKLLDEDRGRQNPVNNIPTYNIFEALNNTSTTNPYQEEEIKC